MIGRGLLFGLNTFERCCQRITFLADHLRHTGKVVCFFDSGNLALVQLVDTLMRTFLAALPEFGLTRDLTLTALAQKPGAGDLTLGAHGLGQMLAFFLSSDCQRVTWAFSAVLSVSPAISASISASPAAQLALIADISSARVVAVLIAAVARSSSRRLVLKA